MKKRIIICLTGLFFVLQACTSAKHPGNIDGNLKEQDQTRMNMNKDNFLEELMKHQGSQFDSILQNRNVLNVQVIYTRIDRNSKGKPSFTDYLFNVDNSHYFYPASTVKFPVAILALQRLNELKIAGLNKNTVMLTDKEGDVQTSAEHDSSSANGRPSIAQYIKKILLVSDNDAFNRLYEFLGQEYINTSLHKMGYKDVQLIHRLDISLTEAQNRHTNPVRFLDENGKLLYEKPGQESRLPYALRNDFLGNGYMKGGQLITKPFDFSQKNRLSLEDLHSILRSVMFPESMPAKKRFNLTADDYAFLHKYMSMFPGESGYPHYDSIAFGETYVKNWMYNKKDRMEPGIRIFNKTGTAYGYLIDIAYIADFKNGIEFMVSGTIYCNGDGIFNDDKYDYDQLGYPFFKNLGQILYEYELKRHRKNRPDLSTLQFNYHTE